MKILKYMRRISDPTDVLPSSGVETLECLVGIAHATLLRLCSGSNKRWNNKKTTHKAVPKQNLHVLGNGQTT